MDKFSSTWNWFWIRSFNIIQKRFTHSRFIFAFEKRKTFLIFLKFFFKITFFLGTLFNEILNMILKYWIKQPRPVFRTEMYSEYGMPSSHSQFMCFFASYVILFVLIRYNLTFAYFFSLFLIFICLFKIQTAFYE